MSKQIAPQPTTEPKTNQTPFERFKALHLIVSEISSPETISQEFQEVIQATIRRAHSSADRAAVY